MVVLGAGSWGTALAIQLARHGGPVTLWDHDPGHIHTLVSEGENRRYLPGLKLPASLQLNAHLGAALASANDLLLVVPSHAFRDVLQAMQPHLGSAHRLCWATKGLESGSGKLLHEVAQDVLGEQIPLALISGPTFAREVAEGLPTAITVASQNAQFADDLAERLHSETFRAYTSTDMIGVEIGGAVKNVLAIAAGIADGLGFGANARTALITRGLAEIMRLGASLGAQHETFMGLAGLGDLVLTCTGELSRNRHLGMELAAGKTRREIAGATPMVAEGVRS